MADDVQMAASMRRERADDALTNVLQRLGPNPLTHVNFVLIEPSGVPLKPSDAVNFKRELLDLPKSYDSRWPTNRSWQKRSYVTLDLRKTLVVGKYLKKGVLDWRTFNGVPKEPFKGPWIIPAPWGGSYSSETAFETLEAIIDNKISKYAPFPRQIRLLVHYGRGYAYNTPYGSVDRNSFEDVARRAAGMVLGHSVPFEHIYLLGTVEGPQPEAFEIFPAFSRCS